MDEKENQQQLGDGEDNYSQGAQKAAEAAERFGQSGANTPPGNAGSSANAAAQQGAESGASQAAQQGAEQSANTAQKAAQTGVEAASKGAEATANAAAATVKAGVETGKAVSEIAAGTAAGGPWGAVISAAWAMRHTLFKILVCVCLVLLFLVAMVVSLPAIIFNYIFRTDPASAGVPASYNIHELYEELAHVIAGAVTAGHEYALERVAQIIADGDYDYELSMQTLIDFGATSAEHDIAYILAAYSAAMGQRGATRQGMVDKLLAVKSQMFPVTYEVRQTTVIIPPEDEYSEPTEQIITYVECTVHPFNESVILTAFGIDPSAQYGEFNITYGQAISNMATALRRTLFGGFIVGTVPPITDEELAEILANLNTTPQRQALITAALSLVGRVPYFWGGKSPPGWNNDWNTPRVVTSIGSSTTGTIRPFGLDCTGFTDWVYMTALGVSIGAGSWNQWDNSIAINAADLLPGDLGFFAVPGTAPQHVLIYAGRDSSGNKLWAHSSFGSGVILNSVSGVNFFRRTQSVDWDD